MREQNLMDSNFNKQDFQKLIEKYLDGKASLEEIELLTNYCYSFQQNNEWEELNPENGYRDRMLKNILEAIQEEEKPEQSRVIRIFRSNVFKFSAAAAVLIFAAAGVFYNVRNSKINQPVQTSVAVNAIKVGSDKATLTTEDGKTIVLEKGKSYKGNNLVSNGQELVYNDTQEPEKAIAYNYLTIPRGGQFFIKLADGTKVWLNSESKLKFPTDFTDGKPRQVELVYGEAYFDVSPSTAHKGSHFNVLTHNQNVEVLGTEFNVKAYQDTNIIATTLVEGKVNLSNNVVSRILEPGDQSVMDINSNHIAIKAVDVFNEVSWKEGVFSFKEMPLKDIMKVLERWYDIKTVFKTESVKEITFNGILDKNQKIERILTIMSKTKKITYEINQKTVIFK